MNKSIIFLCCIVFVIAFAIPFAIPSTAAQSSIPFQTTVLNSYTKQPVPHALILLFHDNKLIAQATTNKLGEAVFIEPAAPNGIIYTLLTFAFGYVPNITGYTSNSIQPPIIVNGNPVITGPTINLEGKLP